MTDDVKPGGCVRTRVPEQVMARLSDLLAERSLVSADMLEAYQDRARWLHQDIDRILVEEKALAETDLMALLSEITGIEVIRMADTVIDAAAIDVVPAGLVTRFNLVPVSVDVNVIVLATCNMRTIAEEDHLRLLLGRPIKWCLCPLDEISECIKHFYGVAIETFLQLEGRDATDTSPRRENVEISTYVSEIISDAVRSGASDIHLEPYDNDACLRYRIDGAMTNVPLPPGAGQHHRAFASALKVLAQMDIAEHRLPQDGRFTMQVDDDELDLRVSVLPTRHGEAVELRILNRETTFITLDRLGMQSEQLQDLEGLIAQPNGITFFTGPTGSGKTTSLYATLANLNDEQRKIVTIEDPVEYQIRGITQLQVHADIGFTFASGLRSVLRHDPDVILIGEIRDVETAMTAIRSSLTGHLVFSTLHTNDAPSALIRLVDMGIEPYLVASSVRGVVAQRLVRCICATCRQEHDLEPWEHAQFSAMLADTEGGGGVQRGVGCPHCRFTGYHGRCAIFEVMVLNDDIRSLVVDRAASTIIMDRAREDGLMTLRESGWARVTEGISTPEEILRVTGDPG